jgi:hypothetical protein
VTVGKQCNSIEQLAVAIKRFSLIEFFFFWVARLAGGTDDANYV